MVTSNQVMYGMSRVEGDLSEMELPQTAEIRNIWIDVNNPIDTSFAKFGHNFYNVFIQNAKGRWTSNSGLKWWEQFGQFRKILPKNTPVYVFEQMDEDIHKTIEEHIKDFRLEIENRYYSHNGFTGYWTITSPDLRQVIKGSYIKDDIVQLGLCLRNGIATGIALGADFFTKRLVCNNGAIGRGENFGSIAIRHVGNQDEMIETFKRGIPRILEIGQKVFEYYEMATAFKFDEKMAKKIYKKSGIAEKYFPEYFGIDKDQKEEDKRINLTSQGKNLTLWEVFNDLTQALTRSLEAPNMRVTTKGNQGNSHLGFSGFSQTTRNLHRQLIQIVDAHRAGVEAS